jgi:outer membrane protein assembly factor BamB
MRHPAPFGNDAVFCLLEVLMWSIVPHPFPRCRVRPVLRTWAIDITHKPEAQAKQSFACASGLWRFLCFLMMAALSLGAVQGADWPQWRGPERSGIAKETGLLQKWPEGGPKLLWTYREAGLGFSSFTVVGDKLYTLGSRGDDEIVLALDAAGGKELWTAKIGPIFTFKINKWGDGPRGTPTIDGNHLYAIGGQGILVCLDIANQGKEVWRKDFIKDLGGAMMTMWGYSESPLVDGDLVICAPGGAAGAVAALNKKTGALVWRAKDLGRKAAYGSAVVATLHGVRQYIHSAQIDDVKGCVIAGLGAKDGKVLWSASLFEGPSYSACATPLVVGNTVYVTTLSESVSGCHLFEIGADFTVKDLYAKKNQKNLKNNHGGVVLVGASIYGYSDGLGWVCQDLKTGKLNWDERNVLEGDSGSIIAADGRLYLFSEEGEAVLLEPEAKEWTEHGRFKLPETSKLNKMRRTSIASKTWAHPTIADGRLYLRDCELIFCYDVRTSK